MYDIELGKSAVFEIGNDLATFEVTSFEGGFMLACFTYTTSPRNVRSGVMVKKLLDDLLSNLPSRKKIEPE